MSQDRQDVVISDTPNQMVSGASFSRDQIELIKKTVAVGATDDELKLFLYQAQKRRLDPLSKQIYFQKRQTKNGPKLVFITSIDAYRLTADRTGKYAGNDDAAFEYNDKGEVIKATSVVYKIVGGLRCAFVASARWDEYYPGDAQGQMWNKMPHTMLAKCAEALALRKAFPEELGGMYVAEEMEQADAKPSNVYEARQVLPPEKKQNVFTGTTAQTEVLRGLLTKYKVDESLWDEIGKKMMGKPSTALDQVIKEVSGEAMQ